MKHIAIITADTRSFESYIDCRLHLLREHRTAKIGYLYVGITETYYMITDKLMLAGKSYDRYHIIFGADKIRNLNEVIESVKHRIIEA